LPDRPIAQLRDRLTDIASSLSGDQRILVVGCDGGPTLETARRPSVGALAVPCLGAMPPSFIDYLIARRLVDGVVLAGCAPDDCRARLGARWTAARLDGTRDPNLRSRVAHSRIALVHAGAGGARDLARSIIELQAQIAELPPVPIPRAIRVPPSVEVIK
jgi:coenzyme F420-reducing hydrogenase delta subunit